MVASERCTGDGLGRGVVGDLRQARGEVAVDQLEGFINKYGAPVPGVGVDKPREFINSQPVGGETQVVMAGGIFLDTQGLLGGDRPLHGEGVTHGNGPLPVEAPSPLLSPEKRGKDGRLRLPEERAESQTAPANQPQPAAKSRLQETVENSFGAGVDRGGRPAVITSAVQDRICTLLSVGFSRRQAAAYVDVDHSTISRTAKRDPEFALLLRRAEEKALLQPMLTVIGEAQKNWRAAAWLIRYKGQPAIELTEEEKQELHEERLADARRQAEETKAWMNAASTSPAELVSMLRSDSPPVQTVEVKRSGKGKQATITRTVTRSSGNGRNGRKKG